MDIITLEISNKKKIPKKYLKKLQVSLKKKQVVILKNILDPLKLKEIKNSKENNMRLPLFLKKDDNEGGEFYFLGDLEVDKNSLSETFIEDKKNDKKEQIVRMEMFLDKPIKDDLYKYIID